MRAKCWVAMEFCSNITSLATTPTSRAFLRTRVPIRSNRLLWDGRSREDRPSRCISRRYCLSRAEVRTFQASCKFPTRFRVDCRPSTGNNAANRALQGCPSYSKWWAESLLVECMNRASRKGNRFCTRLERCLDSKTSQSQSLTTRMLKESCMFTLGRLKPVEKHFEGIALCRRELPGVRGLRGKRLWRR